MTRRELLLSLCKLVNFQPPIEMLVRDDKLFEINFRFTLFSIIDDRRHIKDGPDRELSVLSSFILLNLDNILKQGDLEYFPDLQEKLSAINSQ
jgi:hypothetical protein